MSRTQPTKAEIILGKEIEKLRKKAGLTRMQLGKKINQTEQKISSYESGALIPISILEAIAETLESPIQKRVIRRISLLRKIETTPESEAELAEIYSTVFDE